MEYTTLNQFLRDKFGEKVVKLSLDGGFTCPNRDGTLSTGGCIFCSSRGSGDFSGRHINQDLNSGDYDSPMEIKSQASIAGQIAAQKKRLAKKWKSPKYIAYFQAYTNTYAPVSVLREKYMEALNQENIVGLAIATRPDCLNDEVLALLAEISKKTYLWVELGLQTSKEETVQLINRGYENRVYLEGVKKLRALDIDVVTHVILGLPYETRKDMLNTLDFALSVGIQGIKLQLLHVLKDTPLEQLYVDSPFPLLSMEEYGDIICDCLCLIPHQVVIHRLTGDGAKKDLIAPLWSGDKKTVLNYINRKIKEKKFAKF